MAWPPAAFVRRSAMRVSVTAVALGFVFVGLTPGKAGGQMGSRTPYSLSSPSNFARGCFGPCACPVLESKLTGTFDLRSLPPDPMFSNYAVENVKWVANESAHPLAITGSGTYRVGGEVAVQERMILDLAIDGGPTERYDSGDVAGGGDFPRITIVIRRHLSSTCLDTVMTIDASPGVLGIDPRDARLPRMSPNPFASHVDVRFAIVREGPVELTILDLSGRRVRRLARGEWMTAGVHSRVWDGAEEDGMTAPAGLYRVRIEAEGRATDRTV